MTVTWCTLHVTIQPPIKAPVIYNVGNSAEIFTVGAFNTAEGCIDTVWTYTYERYVAGSPTLIPTFISNTGFTFTVYTIILADVGTYTIRITANV
jgi:hypothetical protein